MNLDIQKNLALKIEECDLLDCLKEKLHANNIFTVGDLTETKKETLWNIFRDSCDEGCFLNCCMMDIEFLLKDMGLCLLQEEDAAEDDADIIQRLQEENEALRQENAFLKSMIEVFSKNKE